MRDVLLIIRREFGERVASRSFVLGTLLFPLAVIALAVAPRVFGRGGAEHTFALVNEAAPTVAAAFTEALSRPPESAEDNRYRLLPVEGRLEDVRNDLAGKVERKEIDGFIVLPADVLDTGKIQFRARNIGSFSVMRDLRTAGNRAVQSERIQRAGVEPSTIAAMIAPVAVDEAKITAEGEERGGAFSTFLTAYLVAALIYIMTTLYGVAVMRSVLEEKTNRIAEVLISTVRPMHLVVGKVIGVGSAAVAQVLIWAAILVVVATQLPKLGFSLPSAFMQAIDVEPLTGILLFLFFLLGFFLYASVFAVVGASVTSEQEAQSVQFMALIPLITPMMFLEAILNAPFGKTATILALVPLTAPIAMPMRMASVQVPATEIVTALTLMLIGMVAVAWVAGKIYRVGMLSTGKRPTLAELLRWLRAT